MQNKRNRSNWEESLSRRTGWLLVLLADAAVLWLIYWAVS